MSVPVIISPFTCAVARRTFGSFLPNSCCPSGMANWASGAASLPTVCAISGVSAVAETSMATRDRRLNNFIDLHPVHRQFEGTGNQALLNSR